MADSTLLDESIFTDLKARIEEETLVRDALTAIVQRLDRAVAAAQGQLSRVHSTPRAKCAFASPPPALHLHSFHITFADAHRPCTGCPGRRCRQGAGWHHEGAGCVGLAASVLQVSPRPIPIS